MPSPTVSVVITYQARAEEAEAAAKALSDLIATVVAAEPDCHGIRLYLDPTDPSRILLFEEWTSREAYLGPHLQTPHITAFRATAGALFAGPPEIRFWGLRAEHLPPADRGKSA